MIANIQFCEHSIGTKIFHHFCCIILCCNSAIKFNYLFNELQFLLLLSTSRESRSIVILKTVNQYLLCIYFHLWALGIWSTATDYNELFYKNRALLFDHTHKCFYSWFSVNECIIFLCIMKDTLPVEAALCSLPHCKINITIIEHLQILQNTVGSYIIVANRK